MIVSIDEGNLQVTKRREEEKNFIYVFNRFKLLADYKVFKMKKKLVNYQTKNKYEAWSGFLLL